MSDTSNRCALIAELLENSPEPVTKAQVEAVLTAIVRSKLISSPSEFLESLIAEETITFLRAQKPLLRSRDFRIGVTQRIATDNRSTIPDARAWSNFCEQFPLPPRKASQVGPTRPSSSRPSVVSCVRQGLAGLLCSRKGLATPPDRVSGPELSAALQRLRPGMSLGAASAAISNAFKTEARLMLKNGQEVERFKTRGDRRSYFRLV